MYNKVFIDDFTELGVQLADALHDISRKSLFETVINASLQENPLFTANMQLCAIESVCDKFLKQEALALWLQPYEKLIKERDNSVLIVMAGNIPMVGFHDLLVTLAAGYKAVVKLSSKDRHLIPAVVRMLCSINSYWNDRIQFVEKMPSSAEILLATGSDESAYYFESKFAASHKIIRGSRSSMAVLYGDECKSDLVALAKDVFLYYGLGCRSVSTLLVPSGYDLTQLLEPFSSMKDQIISHDYKDAYRYQRAVYTMVGENFIDGGFYLLRRSADFPPPLSVVNFIEYDSIESAHKFLKLNQNKLQCIVNLNHGIFFGETQVPEIDQYADEVNSLEYLLQIN